MEETRSPTAEEESLKKNTDCVYFLASPLTCKKGIECEYRHSEGARLNPRDCYYWLNSNCLNLKCAFRHPPLDGLLVPPGSGPAMTPPLTGASKQIPKAHTPYNTNRQSRSEPCIFFKKGYCLKGERCPFSHELHSNGNVPPHPEKVSPSLLPEQPQAFKKEPWGLKQCANQQDTPKVSADIASRAPVSSAIPVVRAEASSSNGLIHHPVVYSSNAWSRTQNHQIQNDVEPGEIVGEHSSVFDVHVANNMEGSAYFWNGDDFGRKSAQGGRKPEPLNDYKCFNIYNRNQYDTKQHRSSSERNLERSQLPERRTPQGHKSPDDVDRADLRHRLKQRKLDDRYVEKKHRGHHTIESSVSARLRGRISLSCSSSGDSLQPEKDRDLYRNRGRLSSPRPSIHNQGRRYDRTRITSEDPPLVSGSRSLVGRLTKREDGDSVNFNGPKSLAELKGTKYVERSTKVHQESEGSLSFEGPKPLSALLKRKREGAPLDGVNSSNGDENNRNKENAEVSYSDTSTTVLNSNKEYEHTVEVSTVKPVEEEEEEEDLIPSRDEELIYDGESSTKDYMEVDAMEHDEGLQNLEQRDDEYDYEANETGDLKTEYASQEEEDEELDDEEDFARKAGLLFS